MQAIANALAKGDEAGAQKLATDLARPASKMPCTYSALIRVPHREGLASATRLK